MKLLRLSGMAVLKIQMTVIGIILVLYVWYTHPQIIVALLDFNLAALKWACGLAPAPYGAMAEVAFRGMLGADKAMLFAEGTLVVRSIFFLPTQMVRVFARARGTKGEK